jgi:hypothetical protein
MTIGLGPSLRLALSRGAYRSLWTFIGADGSSAMLGCVARV